MELNIVEEPNGSWTNEIISLEVSKNFLADYDKQHRTIRPLVSGRVSLMMPDREYKCNKVSIGDRTYLKTERTK